MTVTLTIPADIQPLLEEKAAQRGQALPDYLLTLAEADIYESWQSEEDREEEVAILKERIQDRLSGEKGILLEDYWAGVMAKRQARVNTPAPEMAA